MDIRKLQRAIVDGLEDVKAHNIVVFNTEHLSPLFERVIVASGNSNRQTRALASSVRESVKARGLPILSVEGTDNGEWIIVDCGAAVAHIMQPAIRDDYRLEELWGDKPVKMKLDGASFAEASRAARAPSKSSPAKTAPAKKPTANKVPAKKAQAARAKPRSGASKAPSPRPGVKPPRPAARKGSVRTR